MQLKNLKMRKKLLLSHCSIIAISIIVIMILLFNISNIEKKIDGIYTGPFQNMASIHEVRYGLVDLQRALNRLMLEGEGGGVQSQQYTSFKTTMEKDVSQVKSALAKLEQHLLTIENKQQLKKIQDTVTEGEKVREQLVKLLEDEDYESAFDLNYGTYLPIVDEIKELSEILENMISETANEYVTTAKQGSLFSIILGVIITGIGLLISFIITAVVTKIIMEPVRQITDAAQEMYKGDMKASKLITYESKDELGSLADCMRGTMNNLDDYIDEISSTLVQIAKGDLTQSSDEITNFLGDFANIKESFVFILKHFNSTLADIQNASRKVDSGSTEISKAAQSLSEGTTEQAGALEELTATIETVTKMAKDSADKTQKAYENVKKSAQEAEDGSKQMERLTEEMQRITVISKEIENIITAIEDIASQTNLLSLNASIEAARAGEAGRGFAVVADQIGKLASDSAQSAVTTRELIIKTLEEIEKGNGITVKTSKAFEKVINDMREFAEVAQTTNETAESQAIALQQVEHGIEQISNVVQTTATAAEESSSISEELSEEANRLDKLVRRFKLYDGEQTEEFED